MRDEMKRILISKKGDSYIYLCVIVLFISMLLSVLILYMGLTAQVQIQKRDVKAKLDSYVSEYAITVFNALKQGGCYENYIDMDSFIQGSYDYLGFGNTDTEFIYPNGSCTMTRPTLTPLSGTGFGLVAEYTVNFHVIWNGTEYAELTVPVRVTSYYKMKG